MMKSFESIRYLCENGEMDFVVNVVLINIKTKMVMTAPLFGGVLVSLDMKNVRPLCSAPSILRGMRRRCVPQVPCH